MADELEATPDQSTVKLDLLTDHVNQLVTKLDAVLQHEAKNSNTTTVTNVGVGPLLSAALATMFCTIIMLVAVLIWLVPEIHDLRAYATKHDSQISTMREKVK